jgi:hypothetical protein
MSVQELVSNLPRDKRALLCELLIEIILDTVKNELPNELVFSILALWNANQLITIKSTVGLIETAKELDPNETLILLTKFGLTPISGLIEVEALNGQM